MSLLNLELEPESYLEPGPGAKPGAGAGLLSGARPWSQTKSDTGSATLLAGSVAMQHAFPHK